MKKVVVFTGAGISAESGLNTFRDSDGLWEQYDIMEVATPEAWAKQPELVLKFYNQRKQQILEAQPNAAHTALAELENHFDVQIITQNIDDLHERAGSNNVLHLHGLITKVQSSKDPNLVFDIGNAPINYGDLCEDGSQIRPHVVWFGEDVPNMPIAYQMVKEADIFIIIGTSLSVHPAASLIYYCDHRKPKFLVDPKSVEVTKIENLKVIQEKASTGIPMLAKELIKDFIIA